MNRIKFAALAILCMLSACSTSTDSNWQFFILGKWTGESSRGRNSQYVLKFLPFNILLADIKTSEGEAHNILFTYHFLDKNRVAVEGRFFEELDLTKQNTNLVTVRSIHGFIPDGYYKRDPIFYLYFLSIFLLVVFLFSIGYYRKNRRAKIKLRSRSS
jgi:hypothetical protein